MTVRLIRVYSHSFAGYSAFTIDSEGQSYSYIRYFQKSAKNQKTPSSAKSLTC